MNDNKTPRSAGRSETPKESGRLGAPTFESDSESRESWRPAIPESSQGVEGGSSRINVEANQHHLRSGHEPGVPAITTHEALLNAFMAGNFEEALKLLHQAKAEHASLVLEVGDLRFKQNFGTSRCNDCDGLKAGPDVVATCFQVKKCYYTSVKAGSETKVQLRIISTLFDLKK